MREPPREGMNETKIRYVPPGPSTAPDPVHSGIRRKCPPTVNIHGFEMAATPMSSATTNTARRTNCPRHPVRLRGVALITQGPELESVSVSANTPKFVPLSHGARSEETRCLHLQRTKDPTPMTLQTHSVASRPIVAQPVPISKRRPRLMPCRPSRVIRATRPGICNWPQSERPREQLLERGPQALSDGALLALLG